MHPRRLVPLGVAVTALLAVAAVATRGRPLGGGGSGRGPAAVFFDYVFTTIVLLAVLVALAGIVGLLTGRIDRRSVPSARRRYLASLLGLVTALLVAWLLAHSRFELNRPGFTLRPRPAQTRPATTLPASPPQSERGARLRWDEVAAVLALLAALGVAVAASRSRRLAPAVLRRRAARQAVFAALDESLDDLRAEPDLRRAIVAAYARMERALAAAGLRRHPAEAPVEYLERALRELETSAAAVRRLTELFEWAKFSQHEPEPQMRDEAIDALVAVRDELRAPPPAVAA